MVAVSHSHHDPITREYVCNGDINGRVRNDAKTNEDTLTKYGESINQNDDIIDLVLIKRERFNRLQDVKAKEVN